MSDLYPTKTRLHLLAGARDGKVVRRQTRAGAHVIDDRFYRLVTSRVAELVGEGWLELDPADADKPEQRYRLTGAGDAVLDGAS